MVWFVQLAPTVRSDSLIATAFGIEVEDKTVPVLFLNGSVVMVAEPDETTDAEYPDAVAVPSAQLIVTAPPTEIVA